MEAKLKTGDSTPSERAEPSHYYSDQVVQAISFPLSTSCSHCSKHKTKCDGKRKGCQRYQLYRTVQPRYSRPLREQFRTAENSGVYDPAAGVSKQYRPVANHPRPPTNDLSSHPKITRQPPPAFKDEAIAYFLREDCVQLGMNGFGGHLDSLQGMYQSSPHDSCLRKTTIAAASLCLSRHYKSSRLYSMACGYYNTAVRAINRNLTSTSRSFNDETLMSILLLGMIEDIDSHSLVKKSYHMLGIARIYEIAGQRLLNNIHKSKIDGIIFSDLQIPSLTADKALDCLAIPHTGLDTHNFYIRLSLVATRIGHFHRRAKQFSSSGVPEKCPTLQRKKLLSVIQEAMKIQSDMVEVAGALPPEWRTWQREDTRLVRNKGSATTSSFLSCCRTLVRVDYRSKQPTPETHLAETSMPLAEAQIKRLITSICTLLPYLMGETDEWGNPLTILEQKAIVMHRLIWPLAIIIASPQSTLQQVQDCRERLNWIRDRSGGISDSASVKWVVESDDCALSAPGDGIENVATAAQDVISFDISAYNQAIPGSRACQHQNRCRR
ncbi:Arginine metabolism regulation II [Fusarium subglutinans]|uniref:Arginine metabolism regulation II n=1 Tax=Gibberella subglutinans TaxID=42677 RepID=A0A8H5Q1P7_GIBSU|nr:Arginine metabolism regulation II [Fusarium subglutinans]KAF5606629.1 Arginine metabolism regulation II [Fusarium subglutinans]